jgi:Tfp pilus assembly protein PilV
MNKFTTALLAIALSVPVLAFAQSSNGQDTANQEQRQAANQSAMNQVDGMNTSPHHEMTGTVNEDGTRFTSNNVSYQVANPHALKKYENQNVTVKFQNDTESNKIKIDKVNPSK